MANSQRKSDKIDSNTIIRENENPRCKIISYCDNRHFQMKEVDIEI